MFNSSARVLTLCTLTGAFILGGCAASPTAGPVNLSVVAEAPAPAQPRVNQEVAARMARSALASNGSAIQLGAGDRFGAQMHAHYVAALQTRERNRMYAEIGVEH